MTLSAPSFSTQNNSKASLTATYNDCTCPLPDELQPLSWQNAFWSLIALGLNAMAQVSTAQVSTADGNEIELAFSVWRSSPLVCFAETVVMLMWAVMGRYHGCPLRDCLSLSRRHLLSERKRALDAQGPSNFIALVMFLLVPLPQILKIMASTGIYWTKAWAMAFFLVSVLTFPVPERGNELDRWRLPHSVQMNLIKWSGWLYKLSLAVYVTPWISLVAYLTWLTWYVSSDFVSAWQWPFWLRFALLIMVQVGFLTPWFIAICGAMLIDVVSRCIYRLRGEPFATVVWSSQWMAKIVEPGPWKLWGPVFASWHLIAGLLCYSSFYDEAGTTKPKWAEKLA